ncbi:hypothetical protein GWI33_021532, partial [Rhynchophorus ferrugineus]
MLTSTNQYLRPEYLTPLPTTLDAKKSPLALLAQTCSQIGADTPNNKLLQSAEKSSKKNEQNKDKSRTTPSGDITKSAYGKMQLDPVSDKSSSPDERSSSVGNRVRTPNGGGSLKNGQVNGRCGSNQSAASTRESPAVNTERKTPADDRHSMSKSPEKTSEGESTTQTSSSKTAFTPNILTSSSDPAIKDLPLGTFKPGVPPSTGSAFLSTSTYPGFPGLSMDLMTSSLISRSSALNPYLSYGRLKTQDSLAACRDPYCTGCSVSSHLLGAQKPPCPAGCTQCDHAKVPTTAAYSAYAHAQLAALAAANHMPYVCNWISGDASYCGKRFPTSDELLAHLRTHTSVSGEAAAANLSL